ncbi:MAG: hypothetical protein H6559_10065 [Lewinellaceae bacterium]|nr:hypothetical protein [Lewinellaceae bacterium]
MKPVRILSVAFDTEIAAHETPAFRGAVIEKVGLVPQALNTRAVSRALFPPGHVAHRSRSSGYAPSSRLACQENSLPKQPRYLVPEALEHELFHNHNNDPSSKSAYHYRYRYPLVYILGRRFRPFEGVGMLTFDLRFKADVVLPAYIGLGRGVSQGFGVVGELKPKSLGQKFANN